MNFDDSPRRIALVQFQQSDGSLFVQLPDFQASSGFVSTLDVTSSSAEAIETSFTESAETSHLVKFSYHPDGRAHFSQTGKVQSRIGKSAIPPDSYRGPLFVIVTQGFSNFEVRKKSKRGSNLVDLGSITDDQRLTLTGFWYECSSLSKASEGRVGPSLSFRTPSGNWHHGVALAPKAGHRPRGRCVVISADLAARPAREEPFFLLAGAFDVEPGATGPPPGAQCLVAAYPKEAVENLPAALGTIDLIPDSPAASQGPCSGPANS